MLKAVPPMRENGSCLPPRSLSGGILVSPKIGITCHRSLAEKHCLPDTGMKSRPMTGTTWRQARGPIWSDHPGTLPLAPRRCDPLPSTRPRATGDGPAARLSDAHAPESCALSQSSEAQYVLDCKAILTWRVPTPILSNPRLITSPSPIGYCT